MILVLDGAFSFEIWLTSLLLIRTGTLKQRRVELLKTADSAAAGKRVSQAPNCPGQMILLWQRPAALEDRQSPEGGAVLCQSRRTTLEESG